MVLWVPVLYNLEGDSKVRHLHGKKLSLPIWVRIRGKARPMFTALRVLWLCNDSDLVNIFNKYDGPSPLRAWQTILHFWTVHLCSIYCNPMQFIKNFNSGGSGVCPNNNSSHFLYCFMSISLVFWGQFDQAIEQYSKEALSMSLQVTLKEY